VIEHPIKSSAVLVSLARSHLSISVLCQKAVLHLDRFPQVSDSEFLFEMIRQAGWRSRLLEAQTFGVYASTEDEAWAKAKQRTPQSHGLEFVGRVAEGQD
jgi:hypothetical protein